MAHIMRAGIYVRVSTQTQEREGTSLDTQEAACRAYAAERGYLVEDRNVYRETHTGAELHQRRQLSSLRDAVRRGRVEVVVCHAVDRLAREQAHLAILVDECDSHDVRLEFVTEDFENSAVGKFIRSAKAFAAELEREKIRERTQRGTRARAEALKPRIPGIPLYGYAPSPERDRYMVNPMTAPVVQRIFAAIGEGMTLRGVAAMLNEESVPSPARGRSNGGRGQWYPQRIREIIKNPAYSGRAEGQRWLRGKVNGKRLNELRPKSERVQFPESVVPALVSTEAWERANERIAVNQATATRNNRNPEATLLRSGFIFCGRCRRRMHVSWVPERRSKQKRALYQCRHPMRTEGACSHTIAAESLDREVWRFVVDRLTNPMVIAQDIERLHTEDPEVGTIEALETAIREVDSQIDRLMQALRHVSQPAAMERIGEELDALAKLKQAHEAERDYAYERRRDREQALQLLESLQAAGGRRREELESPDYPYERKREDLRSIGLTVTVWPNGEGPIGGDLEEPPHWMIRANPGPSRIVIVPASTEPESADPQSQIESRPA